MKISIRITLENCPLEERQKIFDSLDSVIIDFRTSHPSIPYGYIEGQDLLSLLRTELVSPDKIVCSCTFDSGVYDAESAFELFTKICDILKSACEPSVEFRLEMSLGDHLNITYSSDGTN
ncbi:MAG: hypothetical protein D6698_02500 [Gammaproteobacteria bacterium]|nr:MAG: hypothetical protein D6698_02500 [Gammaproteobacteria bacterium]